VTNEVTVGVFDVGDYEDQPAGEVVIKNPMTGEPTSLVVLLAGPEHPIRKRTMFERQRQMRRQFQKTGKLQLGDPVEDEEVETAMLADFTLGWRGFVLAGGDYAFSRANALAVYANPKMRWLRDQVKTALDERESFIKRSGPP
jgi:hypothetical protein